MASENFANNAQTFLTDAVDGTTDPTTITVDDHSAFPSSGQFRIRIDDEILLVTSGAGTATWTVDRELDEPDDTDMAAHGSGAVVTLVLTAGGLETALDKLRNCEGLSVLGRSSNSPATGEVEAITAATDGQVLRRSGSNLAFGLLSLSTGATGTLPVANGGTGQTSFTDGQLLIGNGTGNTLTKATLTAGSNITITNGAGSIAIASSAAGMGVVDWRYFSSDDNWTKPANAKLVRVIAIGGGAGGGSGRRGATSTTRGGGGGGAPGNVIETWFNASQLTSPQTITIPAAATGGAAVTSNTTNGNPGADGGSVYFGGTSDSNAKVRARGGKGGGGGTGAGTGTGGVGNTTFAADGQFFHPDGGNNGSDGAASSWGPGSGGGGASLNAANGSFAGGEGGTAQQAFFAGVIGGGGAGGPSGGGAGANGDNADNPNNGTSPFIFGAGGGGGGSTNGAGFAGGNGGDPGGGGGGGSASLNGNSSGPGGAGGKGGIFVITYS